MLRVAIVGGGIGGLATGIALTRAGASVDIYEQAPEFTEIGAGIGLFPNAMRVLDSFGLRSAVAERGFRQSGLRFRRWQDGRVLSKTDFSGAEASFGSPYFTIHRAHLVDLLVRALPQKALHLEHQLESLEQDDDRVRLTFANGRSVEADVAIGADGIKSPTAKLIGLSTRARSSGYGAYRTVIPAARVEGLEIDDLAGVWLGPGKHFAHYWVDHGRLLNTICYVSSPRDEEESWTAVGDVREARALYAGWHPIVRGILDAADEMLLFGLYDRPAESAWNAGRTALIGDAAHPMLPFYAQGAAQALEDALTLEVLLRGVAPDEVARRLDVYSTVRVDRVRRVQEIAFHYSIENHYPDGPEQEARDRRLADPGANSFTASEWLYGYDVEGAAAAALETAGMTG